MSKSKVDATRPEGLERNELLHLYEQMVVLRRFELAAQASCKTGEIGFVHLYVGEEATAVGVCAHLNAADWVTSTHRGHGHALAKGMSPRALMAELYGKATGCCAGRGGSMHLYDAKIGLFGTNGIVCGGNPSAVGAAISARVRKSGQVAVAFFGDGGSNLGSFHEPMNFAGIQHAPVVFVCENNLYATATPLRIATLNTDIASKAAAHGIPGVAVDGNDILAVWRVTKAAVDRARAGGGPTLIESRTYRTVGHHEGDPVVGVYRTQAEIDEWKKRDPILSFRQRLTEEFGVATAEELDAIDRQVQEQMTDAVAFARSSPEPEPASAFQHTWHEPINPPMPPEDPAAKKTVQGWLDAVRDGIAEEMRRDPHILLFGEGIGERGGSFAHTKNLWKEFGGGRVIDTPICEHAFTGAALGFGHRLPQHRGHDVHRTSVRRRGPGRPAGGQAAVHEQRPDDGPDGDPGAHRRAQERRPPPQRLLPPDVGACPGTDRGHALQSGRRQGHDENRPARARSGFDARGQDALRQQGRGAGGRASRALRGGQGHPRGPASTIVTVGTMVPISMQAAELMEKEGVSCEVVDLRTLVPLDTETVAASLAKTGRMLVVDEGYAMCGVGGEIAQSMMELAFEELDAPIGRIHTKPSAHPYSWGMLEALRPTADKVVAGIREVMAGRAPMPRRAKGPSRTEAPAAPVSIPGRAARPGPPVELGGASRPALPSSQAAASTAKGEPVTMPHGDLTVTEATIVKWYKKVGDAVAKGEALVDVETDKAVMAVEAPSDGVVAEVLAAEGKVVKMGQLLAVVGPRA